MKKPFPSIWRIVHWALLAMLASLVLVLGSAYGSQWLLRWRSERLMAEMHRIRLFQTDWAEAQKLMHEWGAWGHYDGNCTAADCRYEITIGHSGFGVNEPGWFSLQLAQLQFRLAEILPALRPSTLNVRFVIHAGTVWRQSALVVVNVPSGHWNGQGEYSLIVATKSEDRLRRSPDDPWILGSDAQLAEHPYYKVGRPSGCTNCMAARVTYSTHAPQGQIDELTNFDFSCFTRWQSCRWLGDLLPKAWEWRLYSYFEPGRSLASEIPSPPWPCDIPLWALGRDLNTVLVVEVLKVNRRKDWSGFREEHIVRVDDVLKGVIWRKGVVLDANPYQPDEELPYEGIAEKMEEGKRYLLVWNDEHDDPPPFAVGLERCGVQEDTPYVRSELEKGFEQHDDLRLRDWY
jgi:hypothetical protein